MARRGPGPKVPDGLQAHLAPIAPVVHHQTEKIEVTIHVHS